MLESKAARKRVITTMAMVTAVVVYACSAYSVVIHALKPTMTVEDEETVDPVIAMEQSEMQVMLQLEPMHIAMRSESIEETLARQLEPMHRAMRAGLSEAFEAEVIEEAEPFNFPDNISEGAKAYLIEAYNQTLEASEHTMFPDPFMALSLGVVEDPVSNYEVFRIPLVCQELLDRALKESDGDYSAAIAYSNNGHSYKEYECVGPLQIAVGWVACEKRNPTIWKESAQMFYEDAELAVPGMTKFAEKCGITVNEKLLMTLVAMRHNVGNLSDWENSNPNSSPNRVFIPFKTKKAVYKWNEAVASDEAQQAIKEAAYEAYLKYIETGVYENQGIGWKEIASITGYSTSNVTSDKQWWRPLYSVRFWFNYYQLQLLYGVETAESLGL